MAVFAIARVGYRAKFAAVASTTAFVLAMGTFGCTGAPRHPSASASGSTTSPRAAVGASSSASAAPLHDPPRNFGGGSDGILVGSSDAVVHDGLAYSFGGASEAKPGDGTQVTVHAVALATGEDQWQRPLPDISSSDYSAAPGAARLAVAAAADGRWWIYYAFPVVIQGTGTEVDQIKLEVGALDARTGAVGWITQFSISQSYLSDASTIGSLDAGVAGADRDHLLVEVASEDVGTTAYMVDTNTHAELWEASGFQPEGLAGGVAVGMTGSGPFADYGTPQGRNAQSGTPVWSVSSVQSATMGTPDDQTAVVSPGVAVFYSGALTNQTYLVSIANGRILKTLSDQYSCEYDQVSVIACYAQSAGNAVLIGLDATSLTQLWQLPDAAGTRIAPVLHAAYKGLLYTEADNGDVILDARTGADLVTDVSIAPDLAVPGYGLVADSQGGSDTLTAYPATG